MAADIIVFQFSTRRAIYAPAYGWQKEILRGLRERIAYALAMAKGFIYLHVLRMAVKILPNVALFCGTLLWLTACSSLAPTAMPDFQNYILDYNTAVDSRLQAALEKIDSSLRTKLGMVPEQTATGVLDLNTLRLAMVRPDRIEYGASVPKIGILLAWFQLHPEAAKNLDAQTRHELGLMIKVSDNAVAAKFSRELGLKEIQGVLNSYGFYDAEHGGGLWVGKHYGQGGERIPDPVGGHSHAVTVRQLLRFYLLLEQGKLVSQAASQTMREIFASPDIAHLNDRFVAGLAGRDVQIRRKAGWWEDWFHDTAIVTGAGRHYIIVALTHHARGDEYVSDFAKAVDDLLTNQPAPR
jgi:beta-lactamase class A